MGSATINTQRMGSDLASRKNWLRALGGGLLLGLSIGCLSPTLPLPPPSRPDVSPPDASGITTITGRVPGGTTAHAQKQNTGHLDGQVTGDSGDYGLRLEAAIGDQIVVWYVDGFEASASVQVTVPESVPDLGPLGGSSGTEN
jgi:hypothetical protein